jgi:hypothetical protein
MKSFTRYITEVATFTAKNFPRDIVGNERFSGAGERTTYVPTSSANTFKWKDGFPLEKEVYLQNSDGKRTKKLNKGDIVHFTHPAKLYKASEIGLSGAGTYAAVSTRSHNSESEGFLSISSVIKPAGAAQSRVAAGSETQNLIATKVEEIAFKLGKNYEFVSTARIGSTAPDLVVTIDGKKIQFEIKGTTSASAPVTFFDKSVNRRSAPPSVIEDIGRVYINNLKLGSYSISTLMKNMGFKHNFVGLIDFYNKYDNKVGLAGDKGVSKSGFLPMQFTTSERTILTEMRKVIIDHFKEGGDNYFVIHNRSNDNLQMYFTGFGENILKLPVLPEFKRFALQTYGGASSGSTRVGLKIQL